MQDLARFRNDPSDKKILYPSHQNAQTSGQKMDLPVHKTTLASDENTSRSRCPIHGGNPNHVLYDCLKLHKNLTRSDLCSYSKKDIASVVVEKSAT